MSAGTLAVTAEGNRVRMSSEPRLGMLLGIL